MVSHSRFEREAQGYSEMAYSLTEKETLGLLSKLQYLNVTCCQSNLLVFQYLLALLPANCALQRQFHLA